MYKMDGIIRQIPTLAFYDRNFTLCRRTHGLQWLYDRRESNDPSCRMLWFLLTTSPRQRPDWITLEVIDHYLYNHYNSTRLHSNYHAYLAWCVQFSALLPLDLKKFLS